MKIKNIAICVFAALCAANAAQPTGLAGFFREGQTFLTWEEDNGQSGETYRIYRNTAQITSGNLLSATCIAEIKEGSSYFREMHKTDSSLMDKKTDTDYQNAVISRCIIQPVSSGRGTQLGTTTGLFVWTVKEAAQADYYYAITTVSSGSVEEAAITSGNSCGPINEQKQPIGAVRYYVGSMRDYYTMWLDYELYRENYLGYAFPFVITRSAFSNGGNMPSAHYDGISTTVLASSDYSNYGCGDLSGNGQPTWYFGYHQSLDWDGESGTASQSMQDTITNYIQYRHIQVALWARRAYHITQPKYYFNGNSMGASGGFGLLMAYPSFVTSMWACHGLTNYDSVYTDQGIFMWGASIFSNYGAVSNANPVKFLPFNDPDYAGLDWVTQFTGMNVYDARDVVHFMKLNTYKSFGLINGWHTYDDESIPFSSQGQPFEDYLKDSRHSYGYAATPGGHAWNDASGYGSRMINYMRWDESRPGFSNVPAREGCAYNAADHACPTCRTYMLNVEWGTQEHSVLSGKRIEETSTSWSIPIINVCNCSNNCQETYTVDITPRNLQTLEVCEDDVFTYEIMDASESVETTGTITADSLDLLLVPDVPIRLSGAIAKVTLNSRGQNYPCGEPQTISKGDVQPLGREDIISVAPNPFNPTTMIKINIGTKFSVITSGCLYICNMNGQTVRTIPIKTRVFSNANVEWNGLNNAGAQVASGVYIAMVIVDGKKLNKKMILAR
ncbi:MAG: hypothetical protein A2268_04115 [Candidatus Raymondbacteria bacterium RifOxyA12_full_50_37]|nr:MAG: hypothetical protein A2268_04115 [Candidatus Raymondbacteria bacterium RifOxyA12_full_50_37]OGJ92591.1 MAG: hypothetical protein A2248_05835 [Candidatus Raymondbacteria bacterium RIFOXYA2_FULL_49_16]OGJ92712.1 MAG: hypothetical protein A2350_16735 [Candidatus Raymondbacteria bacterium RifOxyB12_full_50_8]OGJ97945.1 MAG: hypothetical protein A2453_02860 [Candidatus Raymondbacteria bacterium RIFOXYC2_FULL_50_21]OGK02042.1 MAG: hypothetical protein A2487_01265 [Candidatus Raymondbacteria b